MKCKKMIALVSALGMMGLSADLLPVENISTIHASARERAVYSSSVTENGLSYDIYYSYDWDVEDRINITYDYAAITGYTGSDADLTIPAEIENLPVVLADGAFQNNTIISTVTLSNSITAISDSAFRGCSSLTEIDIPESVTRIGNNSFSACSALTDIVIPSNVKSLGDGAFCDCTNLISVSISEGVSKLGSGAFENCTSLIDISFPSSISILSDALLKGCTNLVSIEIPDNIKVIGERTFCDCSNLPEIIIPNSVKSLGTGVFSGSGITEFTFPSSITSIPNEAFTSCTRLNKVTIPDSVKSIGADAFISCDSLKEITIPRSVKSIGNRAFAYFYVAFSEPRNWSDVDFTIYGYKGTVAETYAKEEDCIFIDLDAEPETTESTEEIKLGDADGSGSIDILDVITLNKAILGKEELSESQLKAIDFNGNGKPDSEESLKIMKYIVGLITSFTE